jgi:alpha-beta hydrolase superfamily lysophospholipase
MFKPSRFVSRSPLTHTLFVAAALTVNSVGCSSAEPGSETPTDQDLAGSSLGTEGARLWDAYVKEVSTGTTFQKGCAPTRIPATDASGKPRAPVGVVVLFHGYTACPQQFMDFQRTVNGRTETVGLASRLSKAGYEVLLPVLPGHGRMPTKNPAWVAGSKSPLPETAANRWPVIDDIAGIPAPGGSGDPLATSGYTKLVQQMNAIVDKSSVATRVVGGMSVGAVLATHATLQASKAKPYTRALIAAPFYQAGDDKLNIARDAARAVASAADLARDPALKKLLDAPLADWRLDPTVLAKLAQTSIWDRLGTYPLGWGEECEIQERKLGTNGLPNGVGRAGICQFQAKHLAGVLLYGKLVQDAVKGSTPTTTKYQVTGVVDDPVVNNMEVTTVAGKLRASVSDARIGVCFYENANHSMFSWHDIASKNQDKAWIPPLENSTIAFLAGTGATFSLAGKTAADRAAGAVPVCAVK